MANILLRARLIRQACYTLTERDTKSDDFKYLKLGIKKFTKFIIDRFSIEEVITTSAKVADLTSLLNKENQEIERLKTPLEIKDWMIENPSYNKLNKLKKPIHLFFTKNL
ncbi:hypothetical protein [Sphingobacterium bovisgrunnientis]|uniref:hypothetical protein n=1 Tax=Sphingobacterium bovisgrunnientis TaxID=1874697 RepID=UPI00135C9370|nr:hypothetical protein [Sphingobacterium bovisgrunnientis]